MNTSDYNESIYNILANTKTYVSDPTISIKTLINNHINTLLGEKIISEKMFLAICHGIPVTPHFYGIPKVHKPNAPNSPLPPFRGIIASINGPTTRAAYYLDSVLNTLVPIYCASHYQLL